MNCRDFLNEFEERRALTQTAMLHLNGCPGCKRTSDFQTRVWQMIERMETVDAPKDFDFRLKARIANAKRSDFQPRFSLALRYVLPLSFAVLLFAFFVFNSAYFIGDDSSVPQVAENNFPSAVGNANEIIEPPAAPDNNTLIATDSSVAVKTPKSSKPADAQLVAVKNESESPVTKKAYKKDTFKGTRDLGATESNVKITPKDMLPVNPTETTAPSGETISATAEQILSQMLGMEIISENGNRKVASVNRNSIAARSGIKKGDVIEAVDGKTLTGEPVGSKTIEAKKLTILRGGERIEISLRH